MSKFTRAHRFNTSDVTVVKSAFLEFCAASGLGTSQQCDTASSKPLATLNGLKRAGLLCSLLLQCNASDITGTNCELAPPPLETVADNGTITKRQVNTTDGKLDLCKLDGTSASDDVSGTTSGTLPTLPDGTKSCERSTADYDCTGDYYCNLDAPKQFYRCTPTAGVDTETQLGVCALKPKVACETCLRAMQPWVDTVPAIDAIVNTPGNIGADFSTECKRLRFAPAVCDRVQQAIASSLEGNLARRAGALCLAMGECKPANLTGDLNATITTAYVGPFSRCSKHGVVNVADHVTYFPSTQVIGGKCRLVVCPMIKCTSWSWSAHNLSRDNAQDAHLPLSLWIAASFIAETLLPTPVLSCPVYPNASCNPFCTQRRLCTALDGPRQLV
jgi:hypothetical protein